MRANLKQGYSAPTADSYISKDTIIILLSTELKKQYKWENGKPTDKITGYKVLCGIPNDYFTVKFTDRVKLPKFGSRIKFKNLEACEVEGNVWFRASDIEEV